MVEVCAYSSTPWSFRPWRDLRTGRGAHVSTISRSGITLHDRAEFLGGSFGNEVRGASFRKGAFSNS
jgi:hypothetical protein